MFDCKEKTQVHLQDGTVVETDSPIIYSGNFLLITKKMTNEFNGSPFVTSEITPVALSAVKKIIINHLTKQYTQYAEK